MTSIRIIRGGTIDTVAATAVEGDYAIVPGDPRLGIVTNITHTPTGSAVWWLEVDDPPALAAAVLRELQSVPAWDLRTHGLVKHHFRAAVERAREKAR